MSSLAAEAAAAATSSSGNMSQAADIPGDPMNSLRDPTFTFHFDKYSCIREFYYAHVFFCYVIAISGANALLPPQTAAAHLAAQHKLHARHAGEPTSGDIRRRSCPYFLLKLFQGTTASPHCLALGIRVVLPSRQAPMHGSHSTSCPPSFPSSSHPLMHSH